MIYKQAFTVRYSEIGPEGYADAAQLLTWFQDAATDHSESVGFGADVLKEMGAAWIVLHWDVKMFMPVRYNQRVCVQTWASGFSAAYGHRMFILSDAEGNVLAEGESVWLLYDLAQNKIKKVTPTMCAQYGCDVKMAAEVLRKWKIDAPTEVLKTEDWTVRRSDTDTNGHVNNVSYVRELADVLNDGAKIKKVRVTYKKSLFLNDVAELKIGKNTAVILRDGEVCTLFEYE